MLKCYGTPIFSICLLCIFLRSYKLYTVPSVEKSHKLVRHRNCLLSLVWGLTMSLLTTFFRHINLAHHHFLLWFLLTFLTCSSFRRDFVIYTEAYFLQQFLPTSRCIKFSDIVSDITYHDLQRKIDVECNVGCDVGCYAGCNLGCNVRWFKIKMKKKAKNQINRNEYRKIKNRERVQKCRERLKTSIIRN